MHIKHALFLILLGLSSCQSKDQQTISEPPKENLTSRGPYLTILGVAQDAGSPQLGCQKACCKPLFEQGIRRKVVSLGLSLPKERKTFLFEASPDIGTQLDQLHEASPFKTRLDPDGIFITHAHIGHYTGLMYLGREAAGYMAVPTYVMPRMASFLKENGPWSQLVSLHNIQLISMVPDSSIRLSPELTITPLLVPHRDEFSETVGFLIEGPRKKALFIPDINKWDLWEENITVMIEKVDYALLDATFYDGNELPGRDMSEIPHPFVVESMALFETLTEENKNKIYFIHFNHTNPVLNPESEQSIKVIEAGYHIAREGTNLYL